MTSIDYSLLGGNGAGGDPPEGLHTAYLAVAKLLELPSGDRLVTEWQVPGSYYWTSWHGFEPNRISVTQEYLDGLGIDRKTITDDDAFENALASVQGQTYSVRTAAWSGGINTFVEDALGSSQARSGALSGASAQASADVDVPIDASGLPAPPEQGAQVVLPDIDDVPF
jgi:hypothetical protein